MGGCELTPLNYINQLKKKIMKEKNKDIITKTSSEVESIPSTGVDLTDKVIISKDDYDLLTFLKRKYNSYQISKGKIKGITREGHLNITESELEKLSRPDLEGPTPGVCYIVETPLIENTPLSYFENCFKFYLQDVPNSTRHNIDDIYYELLTNKN